MTDVLQAARYQVSGVVQGVGFRPFVSRIARDLGVAGWVRNDGGVVTIHAEAEPASLLAFERAMVELAPPLARLDGIERVPAEPEGLEAFRVGASGQTEGVRLVPPDAATCPSCLKELFEPTDRRFRHPFINCTDCGPRFTVIESLPYDRERTSMRAFPMCDECRREYGDPCDRRFHAEPIACPNCGPRLWFEGPDGSAADPLSAAVAVLRSGGILALKGVGGFHLACDATDGMAVARLRERKVRPDKPLAVMVATLADADRWFVLTDAEREALSSWRAPIVLVGDRGLLAPSVAPGHRRQGAMLPSSPLHHMLARDCGFPLVMTSGNSSDEPICITNAEALERLGSIADAFLLHDRDIIARYDDSVTLVRTRAERPTVLRRARSFAPHPIRLATPVPMAVLGTGAQLHGAFCLARGREAYLSQHIGELATDEAMAAYRAALDRARRVFEVEPALAAHDLHPDLLTTRFARELGLPCVPVQHHHAHVVATMAEHGLDGEVLGIAFDGLGLGDDGTIWGGEFLRCSARGYARIGRLRPVPQPGGDAATTHPWRMAAAHLLDSEVFERGSWFIGAPDAEALRVVLGQTASGFSSPLTSSAGRLFDAVASLLGICHDATFEGQPAMLLEQAALPGATPNQVSVTEAGGLLEIDTRDLIAPVVEGLRAGQRVAELAGAFHSSLAGAVAAAAERLAAEHRLYRVVLGGGVFANDLLTSDLVTRLSGAGLEIFLPEEVPSGDGGIALGQAVVAAAREAA